jgi:AcrR family transcriptional regulator
MPRTKQRTPELKDRLLRSAIARLEADGLPGLTIRQVAGDARTSPPALYELFGDRAGLVGAIFDEGFRRLADSLAETEATADPIADLRACIAAFRAFVLANQALAEVMFSRPFTDFDPGPDQLATARTTRELIVTRVRRCTDAGLLAGDPVDISHVLFALARGLGVQEASGLLGSSAASRARRWNLALDATLAGLAGPQASGSPSPSRSGKRGRPSSGSGS